MKNNDSEIPVNSTENKGGGEAGCGAAAPASPLPCLFVTTAYPEEEKEEKPPLPGPRKKQADALTENIKWMAATFGKERIGFLTLTLGDLDAGGRYRHLQDRHVAQQRFHSLFTNVIGQRYQCGVTVTERHRNKGLHFHLAVVCDYDIRGQLDFAACFPPKDPRGKPQYKPDYTTANDALKGEWAFWRRIAKQYGFGRHQLQPMRENAEALGRYIGEYLSKDWAHRLPEDKGARCVRYFGHWAKGERLEYERRMPPPNSCRFGWVTPKARAWREMIKQVAVVAYHEGTRLAEDTIKDLMGPKWAWRLAKLFGVVRFEVGEWQAEAVQLAIAQHNLDVQTTWLKAGGDPAQTCWWHITQIKLDHLRPSPEWKKQMEELQLVKECEAEIRKRLWDREEQRREKRRDEAEQKRLLKEVADLFQKERDQS